MKIPPRQNIHFRDGAVLSRNVSFHSALVELRRLGGPGHELIVSKGRVSVRSKDEHLIAYAVPVDPLADQTDELLRANGGDRPLYPSEQS